MKLSDAIWEVLHCDPSQIFQGLFLPLRHLCSYHFSDVIYPFLGEFCKKKKKELLCFAGLWGLMSCLLLIVPSWVCDTITTTFTKWLEVGRNNLSSSSSLSLKIFIKSDSKNNESMNSLPPEVGSALLLEVFKNELGNGLPGMEKGLLSWTGGWMRRSPRSLTILWYYHPAPLPPLSVYYMFVRYL